MPATLTIDAPPRQIPPSLESVLAARVRAYRVLDKIARRR